MSADNQQHGAMLESAMMVFETASRRTGRTSRLIEYVQNGDQIVCLNVDDKRRLEQLLRQARKTGVRVIVHADMGRPPMYSVGTAPEGRTFFEHRWLDEYWLNVIRSAKDDLYHFSRAMSKTWPEAPERTSFEPNRRQWLVD